MTRQENPNFVASKYAPNPKEVSYWIDLSSDTTGNVIKSFDGKQWIPTNYKENFGIDKSLYEDSGLTTLTTSNQWVKRITNNAAADLFCQEGGAGSTTYFCDYYWTNATASDRTLLLGARTGYGSYAGLFGLYSYIDLGYVAANVGTRLVYIP